MKEGILEANVEAIRVTRELQQNIEQEYGVKINFLFLLEPILHLTADTFIIAKKLQNSSKLKNHYVFHLEI